MQTGEDTRVLVNDGKEFEKLVHLIERSIDDKSALEHDVHLPVIGESGLTRQCDLVIRTGKIPRETITIVEAQDRGRKVERNTFGGWLDKMEEIGAQHLICVSRHDFPDSIKKRALKLGNTVRLITLKELNVEKIPVNFFQCKFFFRFFDVTELTNISCGYSKSELDALGIRNAVREKTDLKSNELCLSLDKNEMTSLFILCRDFFPTPEGVLKGKGKITFNLKEGTPLYMFVEGHFFRIELYCEFLWTNEEVTMPASILSYEQDEKGSLAWVIEASHESSKGPISFKIPVVECEEGYRATGMLANLPGDTDWEFNLHKL